MVNILVHFEIRAVVELAYRVGCMVRRAEADKVNLKEYIGMTQWTGTRGVGGCA